MAETKIENTEREYVVPLRSEWMRVARYKRSRRAVMAIKSFVARHMRVPDRDLDKVRVDKYLNNEVWFRGAKNPPAKVKIRVKRDGDVVRVELAELPEIIKYAKKREEKRHVKPSKKEIKAEEKKDSRTEEEKKVEVEKEKSVADAQAKVMESAAKTEKHVTPVKDVQGHRKALKK